MRRFLKLWWVAVLVASMITIYGAWNIVNMGVQPEVIRITERMKTVCVGRLLVDLPAEAEVELIRPRIDGFDINSFQESEAEFQSRLAERELQLNAMPDRLNGNKNLEAVKEIRTEAGLVGKIFVHGHTVTEGTRAKGLEIERYRYESINVEGLVHADGISFDIVGADFSRRYIGDLSKLIAQLMPNTANRVPIAPGFCIDRAFIREPLLASQREEVMMAARLPSYPDIEFLLIVAAGVEPAEHGLLERNRDSNGRMSTVEMNHVSTIRAASRDIDGITGDELMQRFTEDNSATVYGFWWEVAGTRDNVFVPHISFTMDTGKGQQGPVPSSLSEPAALALWDKVSSSIRVRPTVGTNATAAQVRLNPVGARLPDQSPAGH